MIVCKDILNCCQGNNKDVEECIDNNNNNNDSYDHNKNDKKKKISNKLVNKQFNNQNQNDKELEKKSKKSKGSFIISNYKKSVSSLSSPSEYELSFHSSFHDSSIIISPNILHNNNNSNSNSNKNNQCENNLTFIKNTISKNIKQTESLDESIKQLKFTYVDEDELETKFNTNTNNKKNSISYSKDPNAPLIILSPIIIQPQSFINSNELKQDLQMIPTNSLAIKSELSTDDHNPNRKNKTNQLYLYKNHNAKNDDLALDLNNITLVKSNTKPNDINDNMLNLNDTTTHYSKKLSREDALNEDYGNLPQVKHSRTNFNLVYNHPNPIMYDSIKSSNKDLIKIRVENKIGLFLNESLTIDSKGITNGYRKKRDGYVHFGFTKIDNKGIIINDVILNVNELNNNTITDSSFNNKTLFTIYFDINCQKYFFQPSKKIKPTKHMTSKMLQVYFNIISSYNFISKQSFEMNNTVITVVPNSQDHTLSIQIGIQSAITITSSKQVQFMQCSKGIEISTHDSNINTIFDMIENNNKKNNEKANICRLYYEKGKELWTIIPQSINIWLLINCKQSLEQPTLIKFAQEAIIKVAPITTTLK